MAKEIQEKDIEVIEHLHKKDCGFREKAGVCGFKARDCNAKKCDFYIIDYSLKGIKNQIKFERKEIIKLNNQKIEMKKNKSHKIEVEKYQKIKKDIKDKAIGVFKLSQAYMKIKRTK